MRYSASGERRSTSWKKEILSVIVMSNIPEETLEEKISNDIVDKVIGKYIPDEFSASTYTVPLVYQIATPKYEA